MGRFQQGYIYEAFNAFHVRYYDTVSIDGKSKRVQKSHRLCAKDDKHHSRTCKPVKKLCADFMAEINEQVPGNGNPKDITVVEFWEKKYLPFAKENLRASTVYGYEQIWSQHLKVHFGTMTLKEYRTHMGSAFLTSLTKKLGRHTLQHIRSLSSGIFSHAVNLGLIESNPCRDVKILGKTKDPGDTPHYTLEEAADIISALVDRVDGQLVMALSCFLALRPGEIQGLKWEDFTKVDSSRCAICAENNWRMPAAHFHVLRAVGRGVVDKTKTTASVAPLPLIEPVLIPLKLWHQKSGKPSQGWLFPNKSGNPLDMKSFCQRIIVPALEKKKIEWKGLYAGRRGAATLLTQLTGDALAAKELLRHKDLSVTTDKYVKPIPEALLKGIKLLEAAATANGE